MKNFKFMALVTVFALPGLVLAVQARAETLTKTYTYSYDKNGDGMIESDEFNTYVYQRSDLNADGFLADDEWNVSTARWYKPYNVEYQTYTYWDADKDSRLNPAEIGTLVSKSGLYSKWDANQDGKLSNDEFTAGTFKAYDDNHDGNITASEWKDVLR